MASGMNTTLRQVGTATGVAALGAIFAGHVRSPVTDRLGSGPLSGHAHALGDAVGSGGIGRALVGVPTQLHPAVLEASKAGFVDGLNLILLIGATVAFAAAVSTFLLVRERDMVAALEAEPLEAAA